MDYKWARDFTLELINQYSIAGSEIPDSYNNQADYIKRIPKLLDDAQMYVATTSGRIRATERLENMRCAEEGGWLVYTMPWDFWQMCSSGFVRYDGPRLHRYHRYHQLSKNKFAVTKPLDGDIMVEYYRYPRMLGPDPDEDTPLDNTVEAQMVLPYYVAAHIVMHDNAFAYQALYNEFETRLARLAETPQTDINIVEDAYSAAEWEYNA